MSNALVSTGPARLRSAVVTTLCFAATLCGAQEYRVLDLGEFKPGKRIVTLRDGSLALAGASFADDVRPEAINNHMTVVGETSAAVGTQAWRWTKEQGIQKLSQLVKAPDWPFLEPAAIDDDGDIAGVGVYKGELRGFLLVVKPAAAKKPMAGAEGRPSDPGVSHAAMTSAAFKG
ncbi:MAG: hypothetical protein ACYC96_15695 [Fimbriimonadaceae bacterium]